MKKLMMITITLAFSGSAQAWTTGNPQTDMAIEKAYQACTDLWPFTVDATSGKDPAVECTKDAFNEVLHPRKK